MPEPRPPDDDFRKNINKETRLPDEPLTSRLIPGLPPSRRRRETLPDPFLSQPTPPPTSFESFFNRPTETSSGPLTSEFPLPGFTPLNLEEIFERSQTAPTPQKKERVVSVQEKAQLERTRVLRESTAMQTLFKVVRIEEMSTQMEQAMSRSPEWRVAGAMPESKARYFAPLFATLAQHPTGRILLEEAIDRHVDDVTRRLQENVKDGKNFVPSLVIGSGAHSAAFAAEYVANNPNNPPLIVERDRRIGGNFATAEVALAELNSRNRPEPQDKSLNIPGKKGNLNSLGPEAVVQLPDISNAQYPPLADLGLTIRINQIFNNVWNNAEITDVQRNRSGTEGKYEVTLRDRVTGDFYSIYTDRVIDTSGLGREVTGLDENDVETQRILEEEQLKGADAQVQTFQEFSKYRGRGRSQFPLQGIKNAAIIGPGDSGKVTAEWLLGHGPGTEMSVPNLDWVDTVTWFGQPAQTKDEYISKTRVRYADLALEFPRGEGYAHRIYPVRERARRLRRSDDGKNIDIIYETTDGRERSVTVDHVVIATGFENTTSQLFESFREIDDPNEAQNYLRKIGSGEEKLFPGLEIEFENTLPELPSIGRKRAVITSVDNNGEFGFRSTYFDGSSRQNGNTYNLFDFRIFLVDRAIAVKKPEPQPIKSANGNFIALQVPGEDIYRIGAAAPLPLGARELSDSPALGTIPENTAALFRYVPKDVELARILAQKDKGKYTRSKMFENPRRVTELSELGPTSTDSRRTDIRTIPDTMHHMAPYQAMVRLAVGDILSEYKVPPGLESYDLVARKEKSPTGREFLVIDYQLPQRFSLEYILFANRLINDETILEALNRRTKRAGSRLHIPFSNGKVDLAEVTLKEIPNRA